MFQIKFLKTKEGCAMVQMGDALAVERAVANLNNTTFFGCKMQLGCVASTLVLLLHLSLSLLSFLSTENNLKVL